MFQSFDRKQKSRFFYLNSMIVKRLTNNSTRGRISQGGLFLERIFSGGIFLGGEFPRGEFSLQGIFRGGIFLVDDFFRFRVKFFRGKSVRRWIFRLPYCPFKRKNLSPIAQVKQVWWHLRRTVYKFTHWIRFVFWV